MDWLWNVTGNARRNALWLAIAFATGLALALYFLGRPPVPVVRALPTAAPTAAPTPRPSPPVVTATTGLHQRIVIERPLYPPGYGPVASGPAGATSPVAGPGFDPAATPPFERIVIEQDGQASAEAPIVTPPPITPPSPPGPGVITVADPDEPGTIGITVGAFPGNAAVSYEPVSVTLFNTVAVGPSIILNEQMVGLGGAFSPVRFNPHLYLEIGMSQEFKLVPDPQPYVGAGWRF